MMQRICPVCDQVMKHAHYCSACHSWVKDPVYMNVTYYLNERHPKNEAHCSYHNGEQEAANTGNGKQSAMPWELGSTGKKAGRKAAPNQPRRNSNVGPNTAEIRNRRVQTDQAQWQTKAGTAAKPVVKKSNPVKTLIFLYIALMVVIWLFRLVSGFASSFIGIASNMFDRMNGEDYRELTDESTWFSSTDTYYIEVEDAYAWDSEQNQRSDAADLDGLYDQMMDSGTEQTEGFWRGAGINAEFPNAEDENCSVWIYPDRNSDSYSYGENSESL